jgi:hypothetical protein
VTLGDAKIHAPQVTRLANQSNTEQTNTTWAL